jgi:hypothetical protein
MEARRSGRPRTQTARTILPALVHTKSPHAVEQTGGTPAGTDVAEHNFDASAVPPCTPAADVVAGLGGAPM